MRKWLFLQELGMKNAIHRKKLRLSLSMIHDSTARCSENCMRMDIHQVLRWLDDIGLPQLRDAFADNLIDGPMLLSLTVDDLLQVCCFTTAWLVLVCWHLCSSSFLLCIVLFWKHEERKMHLQMKVTNVMQLATIASGIRLLTMVNFNLNRTQRKYNQVRTRQS